MANYNYVNPPSIIIKPWGSEIIVKRDDDYVIKILNVTKGARLSLQHHVLKTETMMICSGLVKITYGGSLDNLSQLTLNSGDTFHIPPGTIHRIYAEEDSVIFESSTNYLDDIVRHQDDYARI